MCPPVQLFLAVQARSHPRGRVPSRDSGRFTRFVCRRRGLVQHRERATPVGVGSRCGRRKRRTSAVVVVIKRSAGARLEMADLSAPFSATSRHAFQKFLDPSLTALELAALPPPLFGVIPINARKGGTMMPFPAGEWCRDAVFGSETALAGKGLGVALTGPPRTADRWTPSPKITENRCSRRREVAKMRRNVPTQKVRTRSDRRPLPAASARSS
jgi:hypothetical protein